MLNPAGGRGVYILPCSAIGQVSQPTLFDRVLIAEIQRLQTVSPGEIRKLCLQIGADGLAGQDAATAARAAVEAEAMVVGFNQQELLAMLLRQVDPSAQIKSKADAGHLQGALQTLSPKLGKSAAVLREGLTGVAALFGATGIGRSQRIARIPAALNATVALRNQLTAWMEGQLFSSSPDGALVVQAATLTLRYAESVLARGFLLLDDLPALLNCWSENPDAVGAMLSRADWLLDGWHTISVLWRLQDDGHERIVAAMADLVPAIPPEASGWIGSPVASAAGVMRARRRASRPDAWQTGETLQDLIARNEQLRAAEFQPVSLGGRG